MPIHHNDGVITFDTSNLPSDVALALARAHRTEIEVLARALAHDLNFGFPDFSAMIDGLIGTVAHLVDDMTGGQPSFLDRVPGGRLPDCFPDCDLFRDTRLTGPDAYTVVHENDCPNNVMPKD